MTTHDQIDQMTGGGLPTMPERLVGGASQPSTGAPARKSERDLQRAALGELVALSTRCAATEIEIEQRRQEVVALADRELRKATAEIEKRFTAAAEQVQQAHAQRTQEIEQRSQSERSAVESQDETTRSRTMSEQDRIVHDVEKTLQHHVWLAESLWEGVQAGAREDAKKANELLTSQLAQLDVMRLQARSLVRSYRQAVPGGAEPAGARVPEDEDPATAFAQRRDAVQQHLVWLDRVPLPRLFVGIVPFCILLLLVIGAAVVAQVRVGPFPPTRQADFAWGAMGHHIAWTLGAAAVIALGLWLWAGVQVRRVYAPLRQALANAAQAAEEIHSTAARERADRLETAEKQRDIDVRAAKSKYGPLLARANKNRDAAVAQLNADHAQRLAQLEARRDTDQRSADEALRNQMSQLEQRRDADLDAARAKHKSQHDAADAEYNRARVELERTWNEGLERIQAPIGHAGGHERQLSWADPSWRNWHPPSRFASTVRFGELKVDLPQITDQVPRHLKLPETFSVAARLAFPRQASLLIQYDRTGRAGALRTLHATMVRLLTSLPPGRVRFTIVDPVGLGQNFAGFMHLADYDDALVGGRIWTDAEQIQSRLIDLTEHMETVIQKYLRNEFETIDDYNAQAGELAEPYRFLVVADLPANFTDESIRRLNSIATSGARCGVYTLIARDLRLPLPSGTHIDDIAAHSVNLVQEGDRFVWQDDVFRRFPLSLDGPPPEETLTQILNVVGARAREASRVEVPFDTIAPSPEQFWTGSTSDELRVPIGRLGATRLQQFRLGRGVAQHALVAGKTGSGKSTLLHALITNLAMWYSPDEVEMYLVDFKKGVEFKTYATYALPHARAIAVESDREFGLSVLQRLDQELTRRGALFRAAGVQDLASYRKTSGAEVMPRTLLVIDEFQEFFSDDDKLAQEAALLLDRLVRQGRAFGIHVLLGSQTIGGSSGLPRSTIGQMAVRIALQTTEADSQLILGDNNSAARLLSRPGEAIYNDQGGLVEANSPFQVAWLPDERREQFLSRVNELSRARGNGKLDRLPAAVFEGNAPADVRQNAKLAALIESQDWPAPTPAPQVWLGEPVAIKDPTAVPLRRQSGANILIVGQQDEAARGAIVTAMLALAVQHRPDRATFYVLDGTPADSPQAGQIERIATMLPHAPRIVEYRGVEAAMTELAAELNRRQSDDDPNAPAIYVMVYGLQRYRALRKREDSFSFSTDDADKGPAADRVFADLLREGPSLGMHVIAWCDTLVALERTLERSSVREFDHRILFQMSAADSGTLIDSPAANKLGFHRALAYSEEQGTIEKFRPYALPPNEWIEHATSLLRARA